MTQKTKCGLYAALGVPVIVAFVLAPVWMPEWMFRCTVILCGVAVAVLLWWTLYQLCLSHHNDKDGNP